MPKNTSDDTVIRPFADALIELSGGRTHTELSEQLHDLIAAVAAPASRPRSVASSRSARSPSSAWCSASPRR